MHCERSSPLISVRKSLGNLSPARQDRAVQEIVERAEHDALSKSLQRIYVIGRDAELTLEFWFQGCTQLEADLCAAAAIQDAATVELDLSVPTPSASAAAN